jgi:hypothetical protein
MSEQVETDNAKTKKLFHYRLGIASPLFVCGKQEWMWAV